jgi:hypothetical protein
MNKYIKTNSSIILNKLEKIAELSKKTKKNFKCLKCNGSNNNDKLKYEYIYLPETNSNSNFDQIIFTDKDLHMLKFHNKIQIKLYEQICKLKLNLTPDFGIFSTNTLHIIDSVYEEGSNQKYIEKNKNIFNSKVNRFSEHYGLLTFDSNKILSLIHI